MPMERYSVPARPRSSVLLLSLLLASLLSPAVLHSQRIAPGAQAAERNTGSDSKVMTNDDVIRLSVLGIPENDILARVSSPPVDFDISKRALRLLHEQGVSPRVVAAMQTAALRDEYGDE